MPQISTQEFERLSLRVHEFLAGVPLHDVWAIDLPRTSLGSAWSGTDEQISVRAKLLGKPAGMPIVKPCT